MAAKVKEGKAIIWFGWSREGSDMLSEQVDRMLACHVIEANAPDPSILRDNLESDIGQHRRNALLEIGSSTVAPLARHGTRSVYRHSPDFLDAKWPEITAAAVLESSPDSSLSLILSILDPAPAAYPIQR
jgi:hypothetical protein